MKISIRSFTGGIMCDTIPIEMKLNKIFIFAMFAIAVMSTAAFAMGGPAPEVETSSSTAEIMVIDVTQEAVAGDLATAKIELASLEAESEKISNYLDALNKKIIKAKTAGDIKKLSELQATERTVSAYEKKVAQRIAAIKEKYPELKPADIIVVDERERTEPQSAIGRNVVYHDVVMGDTLMSISRKYFGTSVHYKHIAAMNNLDPHGALSQGTSLKIDLNMGGGKVGTTVVEQKAAPKPAAAGGIVYHVVAKGDTLMSISRKYFNGSASYYRQIAEMNGISGSALNVGMKLKIDTGMKLKAKPAL